MYQITTRYLIQTLGTKRSKQCIDTTNIWIDIWKRRLEIGRKINDYFILILFAQSFENEK